MADEELLHKVHQLGDLDLAALLCLVDRQHCIVSTEPDALDDLVAELQLVAADAFGLTSAVVHCTPRTTLDDLAAALLVPQPTDAAPASHANSPVTSRTAAAASDSYFSSHRTNHRQQGVPSHFSQPSGTDAARHGPVSPSTPGQPPLGIANVILAKDLDHAPKAVQIQCLELLRTRRIFTHTSVQAAPKVFLLIAVLGAESGGAARLTPHLNNYFYIAHWHDAEDGFPRLEEAEDTEDDEVTEDDDSRFSQQDRGRTEPDIDDRSDSFTTSDTHSLASEDSVVRRRSSVGTRRHGTMPRKYLVPRTPAHTPLFGSHDIAALAGRAATVSVDIEVLRYQMNIISFLRMHRAVSGGVQPQATQHFDMLVRSLASLHGLDYATPAIVALAARKIYLHRIHIVAPEDERSMQWGSDLSAVTALLDGVGPEDVIEDVLGMVSPPV
ncbi:uncharacterized protein B0I36DRAFT_321016 [Microdochium trichocladiopsis]|uniref:magnesium chelatase n=1 Tax=Microdochium trichocladiopsis TaxID=1682393 RepID=A0A9P9BRW3_9PEZI|nr:uncharacterized protein B0I36DRAFT_321016 [Microdochium trichocladiopsis]KAH7033235.1 hypothetical protein B0I36DRAFT_321016 [Microdochium trichocladiopsis]